MQHTLQRGRAAGLACGAGIAAADGTYAAIAAFGVTAISAALLAATFWLKVLGALVLIFLGLRIALSRPGAQAAALDASGWRAAVVVYGLTLANPPTILFFAGIFASLATLTGAMQSFVFSLGVVLGSLVWWLLLTAVVAKAARLLRSPVMLLINRVSGLVLLCFGLYGLMQSFFFV